MALPKLNDKPKYELVIPSTDNRVRFRPYLVKEEKVLMMALESQDKVSALNAVVDTIIACVDDDIQKKNLTLFDIEYMFIMIRSKSVGEVTDIGIKCQKCDAVNEIPIKLDDVEIKRDDNENYDIELEENISLKMKYPNFIDVLKSEESKGSETDKAFDMIGKCIDSVTTEEEHISMNDVSQKEVNDFIESLNTTQFGMIRTFIEKMPKVQKEIEFTCASCKEHNEVTLQGIDDFF